MVRSRQLTRLADKLKKHPYLAADPHLAVDISDVRLDGARADFQMLGNAIVLQPLTHQIGNLQLTRRQIVTALQIGPLLGVEESENRI